MTVLVTQEGIIGFFDILGYVNFLENNSAKEAAKIVTDILIKLPVRVCEQAMKIIKVGIAKKDPSNRDTSMFEEIIKEIRWLVFSDTILITLPYAPKDSEMIKSLRWILFLFNASMLYTFMFENGLPVRGAITYGEFVIQETCFAGKCIIEAYQLTHDLDLSIVILTDQARQELEKVSVVLKRDGFSLDFAAFEYSVALKSSNERKYLVLNPALTAEFPPEGKEIRQIVAESFWKHNKELASKLMSKLNNTELFLRYTKMIIPTLLSKQG